MSNVAGEGGVAVANEKNLEKGKETQFRSGEEAARNGQKGGIASGESRRKSRTYREIIEQVMPMELTAGKAKSQLIKAGLEPTHEVAIIMAAVKKAEKGDIEATRFLRDTKGEKPGVNIGIFPDRDVSSLDLSQYSQEELLAMLEALENQETADE